MQITAAGLVWLCASSCGHVGQRLLHIEIELDGKVVFTGIRGVRDDMPENQMWDVLPEVVFEVAAGPDGPGEDGGEKSRTLTGKIVVRIKHVDRELASTTLPSLTLSREPGSKSWSLSRAQAERVKFAASK
jgi:hypothetical protein